MDAQTKNYPRLSCRQNGLYMLTNSGFLPRENIPTIGEPYLKTEKHSFYLFTDSRDSPQGKIILMSNLYVRPNDLFRQEKIAPYVCDELGSPEYAASHMITVGPETNPDAVNKFFADIKNRVGFIDENIFGPDFDYARQQHLLDRLFRETEQIYREFLTRNARSN